MSDRPDEAAFQRRRRAGVDRQADHLFSEIGGTRRRRMDATCNHPPATAYIGLWPQPISSSGREIKLPVAP